MNIHASSDLLRQQRLVHALCAQGPGETSMEETHISWVLLTGNDAYKIKKSLDLGFLDFSTLEQRRMYCSEELRLNRRTAPGLYLDMIAIGGNEEQPVLGKEPAIEYAVHMRRFARSSLMDRLLEHDHITALHIDKLAATIAGFHAALPPAPADSPFCQTDAVQAIALQNFALLQPLLNLPDDLATLEAVRSASALEFAACAPLFRQRADAGFIRECHGDLHLGNIVLLEDTPVPFDGIEFNAALRWTDVISDIGFTVMDLLQRGRPPLAWRLLNAYLEHSGDYRGVGVLRFYLSYRAMVRAKVAAIRAGQEDLTQAERELAACRSYLDLAHGCLTKRRPALIITHGLPGSGKSTFAQIALERLGAIRLRSDVERKRLFGLDALARSRLRADIYHDDATRNTYARLNELTRMLINAGFPVIVDAAFLRHAERENFRALAKEMGIPFVIAHLRADETVLLQRLKQRFSAGSDASEADASVLQKLKAVAEPLQEDEPAVTFVNDADALNMTDDAWQLLAAYLA